LLDLCQIHPTLKPDSLQVLGISLCRRQGPKNALPSQTRSGLPRPAVDDRNAARALPLFAPPSPLPCELNVRSLVRTSAQKTCLSAPSALSTPIRVVEALARSEVAKQLETVIERRCRTLETGKGNQRTADLLLPGPQPPQHTAPPPLLFELIMTENKASTSTRTQVNDDEPDYERFTGSDTPPRMMKGDQRSAPAPAAKGLITVQPLSQAEMQPSVGLRNIKDDLYLCSSSPPFPSRS
jgi:hypothetical protein